MKFLSANFQTIILRYYLMMAVVLAAFLFGMPYLSILAVPIFLSALLGVKFESKAKSDRVILESTDRKSIGQAA